MDLVYRGGREGGGRVGGGGRWKAKDRLYYPLEQGHSCCVFNKAQKQPVYMLGQDSCWQQFDTACSLISVLQ